MNPEMEVLCDRLIEYEEEIASLKAEILELRTEEEDESEPYKYAQSIIDNNSTEKVQELAQWHNEVAEYLEVYVGYRNTDIEEDE